MCLCIHTYMHVCMCVCMYVCMCFLSFLFSLKSLLVNFEKKITKNQKLRVKYPNDPDKFMASEVELHEEIQELHTVAASPELYGIIVDTKAVNSILGRFDIS